MNVRVGTAGYAYRGWVGEFFPAGIAQHEMLAFHARHFPAVEINSSFYGVPTVAHAARMLRRTPAGFGFSLKVPRSASHGRTTDDLPLFKLAVDRIAGEGRLLPLLLQVPESFRNTPGNREWLLQVARFLHPHRVAVEFRHRSWDWPGLSEWLEERGLDLVSVAVPAVLSIFPGGLRVANRRIYIRFHSHRAENWYGEAGGRYDFDFPDSALAEWVEAILSAADRGEADECQIFFNNDANAAAVRNARRLMAMLKELAPAVRVIDPPVPASSPSLFPAEWLASGS